MTQLKDVLHFYINSCDCQVIYTNEQVKNHMAKVGDIVRFDTITHYVVSSEEILNVKLILRRLSSMTEAEGKEANERGAKGWQLINPEKGEMSQDVHSGVVHRQAQEVLYLTSIGIDVFGLIDSNQAIEKQP